MDVNKSLSRERKSGEFCLSLMAYQGSAPSTEREKGKVLPEGKAQGQV